MIQLKFPTHIIHTPSLIKYLPSLSPCVVLILALFSVLVVVFKLLKVPSCAETRQTLVEGVLVQEGAAPPRNDISRR